MAEVSRSARTQIREIERGRFRDRHSEFVVCASATDAPDSFRVYENDNRTDMVLVITGVCSGDLRASWGLAWRGQSEEWREWMEAQAFMAFYNGHRTISTDRYTGRVKVCDG
ncbi:hypothetical protein [Glycomyces tarimensis]